LLTDSLFGSGVAPGYLAEYLLLQVWAPPYRFKNDKKTVEINHTKRSSSRTSCAGQFVRGVTKPINHNGVKNMPFDPVIYIRSDLHSGCSLCNARNDGDNIGEFASHYVKKHGYKFSHSGQETSHNPEGGLWQSTVIVLNLE
jgi:hypothetical protein